MTQNSHGNKKSLFSAIFKNIRILQPFFIAENSHYLFMLSKCCVIIYKFLHIFADFCGFLQKMAEMLDKLLATPSRSCSCHCNPLLLSTILLTNFMNKKKPKQNKPKVISFTDLVQALNNKSNFSDNSGKGVVKGKDVSRMNDFLKQK